MLAAEPYPPIQRRKKGSVTAAAAAYNPSGESLFPGTLLSTNPKPNRRGRCPHRPVPFPTVNPPFFHNLSPFPKPKRSHRRGEHCSPEPPLLEEVPVRAEESLVLLEKGDSPQCGEMSRSDKGDGSVRDVTAGDRGIVGGDAHIAPSPFQPLNHHPFSTIFPLFPNQNGLTVGANIVRPQASLEKGGGCSVRSRRRDCRGRCPHRPTPFPKPKTISP